MFLCALTISTLLLRTCSFQCHFITRGVHSSIFLPVRRSELVRSTCIRCPTRCADVVKSVEPGDTNGGIFATPMVVLYRPCKIYSTDTRGGMHETGPKDLRPWTNPKFGGLEFGTYA